MGKKSKTDLIVATDWSGSMMYKTKSSTNKLNLYCLPKIINPLKLSSCFNAFANGSMARANKSGDKGQPCLVPRAINA